MDIPSSQCEGNREQLRQALIQGFQDTTPAERNNVKPQAASNKKTLFEPRNGGLFALSTDAQEGEDESSDSAEVATPPESDHEDNTETNRRMRRDSLFVVGAATETVPLADVDAVEGMFRKASAVATFVWLVLVAATLLLYYLKPEGITLVDDYDDDGTDRLVARTGTLVLLVSTTLQMTPVIMMRVRSSPHFQQPHHQEYQDTSVSGIMVAALTILMISLVTNALLGWGPRAVLIDPMTGSRVFMFRWCEWIPLSGLMTLLSESADLSTKKDAWKYPIRVSIFQVLSTACGIIMPLCQSSAQWNFVMFVSCALFAALFPRVSARRKAFFQTPRGRTVLEREYYDRRRFAYGLMSCCAFFWSNLVAMYFVNAAIHFFYPPGHWLRFPALAMACDTFADILAKVVYTRILVEGHLIVFASDLRMVRKLNELKQLMSMLWISSSDVIVISTRHSKNRNATMLSPSFLALVGAKPPTIHSNSTNEVSASSSSNELKQSLALVLETDHGRVKSAYYVDTGSISGEPYPERIDQSKIPLAYEDLENSAVLQALRITNAAWSSRHSDEPLRALSITHSDETRDDTKVMCEMKVSRHTEETAVAIVRDVTERYRRFEAESRAHEEQIARQRDMHTANRFTRHEVKNGLLSGIELCRTLGQSLKELQKILQHNGCGTDYLDALKQSSAHLDEMAMKSLMDLDGTLHGVLETVLAEVMAREVVHGVYKPRLEELDVPSTLVSGLGMNKDRIPIIIEGGSMPKLLMDAQLVGHIHRNAVSNALKYGAQGGLVKTFVGFDVSKKEFRMEVTNEPGEGHATLLGMGAAASEFVFAQGVRLQPHMKGQTEKLDSSGDGAWIMQKCASTMKGMCHIHFTEGSTRFTFECPAVPVAPNSQPMHTDFVVPDNVWAIGIDDSKIQRKLMTRIFGHVGVPTSRQLLLGETPEDVIEFESTLNNLMEQNPGDKFLVIVDEHLDYDNVACNQHDGIYSGSLIMKRAIEHMPKAYLSRSLILMRSANDSAVDIALYTQRTHGYFPKAIMQKNRTRQILAPLWQERFAEE
ncbi:expressed unknown protein [Seminavis robusta]|uniref:Uncharacterized protein n=1 Tax=Seminavis robusta TaxID=568900 RepID=A0A9N8EQ28_9STRA|nr:expressed unknown protein [Seminavis robusta]|eukprot:Sro1370_g267030.1 n/a (1048) ;mRNA; r:17487-20718